MIMRRRRALCSSGSGDSGASSMHAAVLGEVVRAREPLAALAAAVGLVPRVAAPVPRQLVRPREPPRAFSPRAPVRLLTTMPAQVRAHVRPLRVQLAAVLHRTSKRTELGTKR